MLLWTALCALALAVIHVIASRLRLLDVIPRSPWLSAGSGVAVAYVFVHILPDLAASQEDFAAITGPAALLERHVYLLALLGLAVFYGLERLARRSRARGRGDDGEGGEATTGAGVFWIHVASYGTYNALIGYLLLHRERAGLQSLLLFSAAMATHFVVNDYGLHHAHRRRYRHRGRWILAAAILVGWAIGAAIELHPAAIAALFAFLAGGVVLNVLKEELPEERESAFWAFALGAAVYSALLVLG